MDSSKEIRFLKTATMPIGGIDFEVGADENAADIKEAVYCRLVPTLDAFDIPRMRFEKFIAEGKSSEANSARKVLAKHDEMFKVAGYHKAVRFIPVDALIPFFAFQGNKGNAKCEAFVHALAITDMKFAILGALGHNFTAAQIEVDRAKTFEGCLEAILEFLARRPENVQSWVFGPLEMERAGVTDVHQKMILQEIVMIADKLAYIEMVRGNERISLDRARVLANEKKQEIEMCKRRVRLICDRAGIEYTDPAIAIEDGLALLDCGETVAEASRLATMNGRDTDDAISEAARQDAKSLLAEWRPNGKDVPAYVLGGTAKKEVIYDDSVVFEDGDDEDEVVKPVIVPEKKKRSQSVRARR